MTHPSELKIEDFTYNLPEERIAKYPLANRSDSKLLVYKNGEIKQQQFTDIINQIPAETLLVYNNTKVFYARLEFYKSTGARIEVFCLEPYQQELVSAMQSTKKSVWKCMVGNAKKWKDETLELPLKNGHLQAKLLGKEGNDYLVELTWPSELNFTQLMEEVGNVPLPPYLKRKAEKADKTRYQTVYSKQEGSVAAPTAGLHFTPEILKALQNKGVSELPITLHVGAGTFQPVKSETMQGHDMHAEEFSISLDLLKKLKKHFSANKPIVVVGTTSMRALESLCWILEKDLTQAINVKQWTPYERVKKTSALEKLSALISTMEKQGVETLRGKTSIIIAPGYQFQLANGLITNFHQPKSTLLLLVSAIVGHNWKSIYNYALSNNFRFLSYGDSSLLWKE